MVQLSEEELRQLTETWKDMQEALKQIRTSHKNSAQVHISAGGVGVWLATTACLIMLAAFLVSGFWILSESNKLQAELIELRAKDQQHDDYLSAIYIQAPELKPKDPE